MATTAQDKFDYRSVPFSPDTAQIRLLRFKGSETNAQPIRCEVQVFDLDRLPPYIALSYVWGDAIDGYPLACNDSGEIAITYNLNEALKWRQYVNQTSPSTFAHDGVTIQWVWIDAICINQEDLDERKAQVLLMRQIYERAAKTIIWLGEVDQTVTSLLQTLDSARRSCEAAEGRAWSSMSREERIQHASPMVSRDWSSYDALNKFMFSGWFSRIWVIQELAVSQKPIMLARHFELSWQDFISTLKFVESLSLPMWVQEDTLSHWAVLENVRTFVQRGQRLPLLEFLMTTSRMTGMSATDPRDRVYALLGISQGPGSDIQPDYTVSVRELYMEFQRRQLSLDNDKGYLDFLNVPRIPDDPLLGAATETKPTSLPSWVPDWRDKVSKKQHPFFPTEFLAVAVTQRSGERVAFVPFQNLAAASQVTSPEDVCVEGTQLRLSGLRLSQIEAFGRVHEHAGQVPGALGRAQAVGIEAAAFKSDEQLCHIHSRSRKPYQHTAEDMRDVYWQTLCGGQHFVDYADTKAGFEKWFTIIREIHRFMPATSHLIVWRLRLWRVLNVRARKQLPALRASDDFRHFNFAMTTSSGGRRMFRTEEKHIGLGPPDMEKGDSVFLIKGCRTPMLLRPTEESNQWTLLGACYVHGFMNGEGFNEDLCDYIWLV